MEHWHKLINNDKAMQTDPTLSLMSASDQRNVALVKLKHLSTGNILTLCCVHFMTTSRDGPKTNLYPGEVRAGEMQTVGELLLQEKKKKKDDDMNNMILLGDFNTDACQLESVFGGTIHPSEQDGTENPPLKFRSGFQSNGLYFNTWQEDDNNNNDKNDNENNNNNNDNENENNNNRVSIQLDDVYADIHKGGINVGLDLYCTSRNTERIEWIDYMFATCHNLYPMKRSKPKTPIEDLPNEEHPSDHLPLMVQFEFR